MNKNKPLNGMNDKTAVLESEITHLKVKSKVVVLNEMRNELHFHIFIYATPSCCKKCTKQGQEE